MANALLFGSGNVARACRYSADQAEDTGVAVTWRALTAVFAAAGWYQETLLRVLTLVLSANTATTIRVTPILEGIPYDGTGGRPDARVTFAMGDPAPGERLTQKFNIGLFQPVRFLGSVVGRTGLRATWVQFRVESLAALTIPAMESPADFRLDGVELEWEPLLPRQQVVNAG